MPNTLIVHQLMQLAETLGKDPSALAEDLMSAFFVQGVNIGERSVLTEIAFDRAMFGEGTDSLESPALH